MPKRPGTTARSVRIEDDLWRAALERAAERGPVVVRVKLDGSESVSEAMRKFLERWAR